MGGGTEESKMEIKEMGTILSVFPFSCDEILPRRFGGSLDGNGAQRDKTRIKKTFHSTHIKEEELWKLK